MRPPNEERRSRRESGALDITRGDGDRAIISAAADVRRPWRWTGCPCGCLTRLPWLDDPDCARRRRARPGRELAAWGDAVEHLHAAGLPAAVPEFAAAWLRRRGIRADWETAA